jgi:hypothetical protein
MADLPALPWARAAEESARSEALAAAARKGADAAIRAGAERPPLWLDTQRGVQGERRSTGARRRVA